jgi:7-keto-8-aminopelargonate synthetase-like enzyme
VLIGTPQVCRRIEMSFSMLEVAKEMCPLGNAVFIADEVHATGILGPKGAGLVSSPAAADVTIHTVHTLDWNKNGARTVGNHRL